MNRNGKVDEKPLVVHLTSVHSADDVRIFHKECSSLAEVGYNVVLIAPGRKDEFRNKVAIKKIKPMRNRILRMTLFQYLLYRKAIKENAALYHFHDPELILTGLMLKLRRKKVIYDVHEDVPRQLLTKPWIPAICRKPLAYFFEYIENFAVRRFDYIVTANSTIKKRFLNTFKNVESVKNYPILKEFNISKSSQKENDIKHVDKICFVGCVSEMRGIHQMMEAAFKSRILLELGGLFSSEILREKCSRSKYWKNVNELGLLSREKVAQVMQNSLAGLLIFHPVPNNITGCPNKMFEYLAAGIPVIASNFPLWKEVLEINQCGICVDPFDIKQIINAIEYLKQNPKIARKMGDAGKKLVHDSLNWKKESKKLFYVYKLLI